MKRRIFKQILSGMLGIMLLLSLAGCGQSTANAKPTNTMEAFYDLLIRQDTSAMTDLGIDSKESKETLKTYFSSPKSAYDLSNAKLVHKEDKKFIEEILNIINTNLDNKELSAAFIANELHISLRHLYRKLSEIEVQSINNLIKDCRLQMAKKLLINTKYSIDEIAYKSGFTARSTFFRSFTEKFHITPKEFRKQQQ